MNPFFHSDFFNILFRKIFSYNFNMIFHYICSKISKISLGMLSCTIVGLELLYKLISSKTSFKHSFNEFLSNILFTLFSEDSIKSIT